MSKPLLIDPTGRPVQSEEAQKERVAEALADRRLLVEAFGALQGLHPQRDKGRGWPDDSDVRETQMAQTRQMICEAIVALVGPRVLEKRWAIRIGLQPDSQAPIPGGQPS